MNFNRVLRHRSTLLILLVAAQLLFLGGIAGYHYAIGWFGRDIRIQTVPVDPRDYLYGDYVRLNYKINRIEEDLWKGPGQKPERGDTVYVVLESKQPNGLYEATAAYPYNPPASPQEAVLKGRISYLDNREIVIQYGLEKYYVEENTGKQLEEQAANLIVKVKVAPWGSAIIEGLELQ
jgi:uncharacterized membrane-anchored protein